MNLLFSPDPREVYFFLRWRRRHILKRKKDTACGRVECCDGEGMLLLLSFLVIFAARKKNLWIS